mgnify:CR=1 FL=1
MRTRSVGLNVRVSPAEKHRIQTAAGRCGLSLSEYLRQRAVGYEPRWHPPGRLFEALAVLERLADRLPDQAAQVCRAAADEIRDCLLEAD